MLKAIIDFKVKGDVKAILPQLLAWGIIPSDKETKQRARENHVMWPTFEELVKFKWGDWSHDISMGELDFY